MNHRKIYIQIISNAKNRGLKKPKKSDINWKYYELHHILPKSLFPLWAKRESNLVLLTAREHFFCHQLLDKIYPGEKMFLALWRLSNDNQNRYCIKNSKEYEKLKIRFSILASERFRNNKNTVGYFWITDGKNNKLTKTLLNGWKKGRTISEYTKLKISVSTKVAMSKLDPKIKQKMSENAKKLIKINTGLKRSKETKLKLSQIDRYKIRGKNHFQSKQVLCIELNKIFDTISEAAIYFKVGRQYIRRSIKNKTIINKNIPYHLK